MERRLRLPPGVVMPTNMTIVRLRSGGLALVSPVVIDDTTRAQVEQLGRVEALVAPNSFHYVFLAASQRAFPEAKVFLAPGLDQRIAGLPGGTTLADDAPPRWQGDLETLVFGPVQGLSEVVLLHAASRTLILTDLAFHLVRIDAALDRVVWRLSGVPARFGTSRTGRMSLLRDKRAARPYLERIRALDFERVVVGHGEPLETEARREFERAFAHYLT
jgi:hypothetical protein